MINLQVVLVRARMSCAFAFFTDLLFISPFSSPVFSPSSRNACMQIMCIHRCLLLFALLLYVMITFECVGVGQQVPVQTASLPS